MSERMHVVSMTMPMSMLEALDRAILDSNNHLPSNRSEAMRHLVTVYLTGPERKQLDEALAAMRAANPKRRLTRSGLVRIALKLFLKTLTADPDQPDQP